jgi:hypothetical protein
MRKRNVDIRDKTIGGCEMFEKLMQSCIAVLLILVTLTAILYFVELVKGL